MTSTSHSVAAVAGATLHAEETGSGPAVLFIHEFAGDARSWEPQIRHFSRRYRCITYNARGYPPSSVPEAADAYSQSNAVDDAISVMDALGIGRAHIVGLSMGGFCALHLGLRHPERCLSVVAAGAGYGAAPEIRADFRQESTELADAFEAEGMMAVAARYAAGPYRTRFQSKDPRGWAEFAAMLAQHSALGSALTMRGVQRERPSLWDLADDLAAMQPPVLVVNGDEDEPCLEPGLFLKRTIPDVGLVVLAKTGHTINLEEPDLFNATLDRFFATVSSR